MERNPITDVSETRFKNVEWVSEIESTNTELLRRAREEAPEGEVLIADLQTAGRGRRGRVWEAPARTSLMMSILLRPPPTAFKVSQISLFTSALALATISAVQELTGITLQVKWPNDLVTDSIEPPTRPIDGDFGYRKIAGILTETVIVGREVNALVIGIGINTDWPEVPPHLEHRASSLNLISGKKTNRDLLSKKILINLEKRYDSLLESGGTKKLLRELKSNSATLHKQVKVEISTAAEPMSAIEGTAIDIDNDGQLLVRLANGDEKTINVGDVYHLRPLPR
ncbi:MAG TPA: biotin--[acetyl-CoA-carboxylase] ligase [Acidimicrobiaceae bacterium]|mgnify:CR=1 FL=1|nr:biotin--[acetyl-CoA-carboxylase] ligase [Actinomycetota bacterium]HAN07024.1 biotin--[acetyl-CoA-carboxylase] ligase [Acidimicrobiaceae bacterium]